VFWRSRSNEAARTHTVCHRAVAVCLGQPPLRQHLHPSDAGRRHQAQDRVGRRIVSDRVLPQKMYRYYQGLAVAAAARGVAAAAARYSRQFSRDAKRAHAFST